MGLTLSSFIRGFQIRAECTPVPRSLFARDIEGVYHHRCTLRMGGHTYRRMVVPYVTSDPSSVRWITEVDQKTGKSALVLKSRISTRVLLYNLACEAALYEIAKHILVDDEGNRVGVEHDRDLWAALVFQNDVPLPPPEELNHLYQNTRRMAFNLRVFLEGHEAAETRASTTFRALISEVDEVARFVYDWVEK